MLHFGLSGTLLLAAACSLMTAVVSTERTITCGNLGNVQNLRCDYGVIRVQAALYGRADNVTCSAGRPRRQLANTRCSLSGTLELLQSRCDGRKECELNINTVRTSDPCRGTFKYLETTYTCAPAIHLVACENSLASLQCDVAQIIFVFGAHYGRLDRTTCSFGRPIRQVQNNDCSNSTSVVAERCNGKNSCTFPVSNSVFTDPCVGTYKYLEMAYICESTEERKRQWLRFVFNDNMPATVRASLYVCANHVTLDCFTNEGQYKAGFASTLTLIKGSVPTIRDQQLHLRHIDPGVVPFTDP